MTFVDTDPNLAVNFARFPDHYLFINRETDRFTLHYKKITRYLTPKTRKKQKAFRTERRITLTVKTPTSMKGVPVFNLFKLSTTFKPGDRPQIRNISGLDSTPLSQEELSWILKETIDLFARNNIEFLDAGLLKEKLEAQQPPRIQRNHVSPTIVSSVIQYAMFPLTLRVETKKTPARRSLFNLHTLPVRNHQLLPVFRARSFEDVLRLYPLTDAALIKYLQEKYESSRLTYSDLFLLTIAHKIYTEKQLLSLMKTAESIYHPEIFNVYDKTQVTTLRSVLSKTKFKTFESSLKAAADKDNNADLLIESSLLSFWSRNHRKIKGTKKELAGFNSAQVKLFLEDIDSASSDVKEEKREEALLARLNALTLTLVPLKEFEVPPVYANFISTSNKKESPEYFVQYLKNGYWLTDLALKYATRDTNSVRFKVNAKENLVLFLEAFEDNLKTHFKRQHKEVSVKEMLRLLQFVYLINCTPLYATFKGKLPYTVYKLMSKGMHAPLAFDLILNKSVSYSEICSLYVIDDKFSMPSSYLYSIYEPKTLFEDYEKKFFPLRAIYYTDAKRGEFEDLLTGVF